MRLCPHVKALGVSRSAEVRFEESAVHLTTKLSQLPQDNG